MDVYKDDFTLPTHLVQYIDASLLEKTVTSTFNHRLLISGSLNYNFCGTQYQSLTFTIHQLANGKVKNVDIRFLIS